MGDFVRGRALAVKQGDLAKRLTELEDKTMALAMKHDNLQPQYAKPPQAGLRRAARTDDAARSAKAAYRVRHA